MNMILRTCPRCKKRLYHFLELRRAVPHAVCADCGHKWPVKVAKETAKEMTQPEALEECKRTLREITEHGRVLELTGSKAGQRNINRIITKLEKAAQTLCDKYGLGKCVYCRQLEIINHPPICDECSKPEEEWAKGFTSVGAK